jgi:hypothetical protein
MFEKNSYKSIYFMLCFLIISIVLLSYSCTKPEKEYAVIKGTVNHHEWEVAGMKVYLKKNAKDFPGFDASKYDDSTIASSGERFKAPFVFRNLEPGDYYLMATGFDTLFNMPAKGALQVTIQSNYDIKNVVLVVSE